MSVLVLIYLVEPIIAGEMRLIIYFGEMRVGITQRSHAYITRTRAWPTLGL